MLDPGNLFRDLGDICETLKEIAALIREGKYDEAIDKLNDLEQQIVQWLGQFLFWVELAAALLGPVGLPIVQVADAGNTLLAVKELEHQAKEFADAITKLTQEDQKEIDLSLEETAELYVAIVAAIIAVGILTVAVLAVVVSKVFAQFAKKISARLRRFLKGADSKKVLDTAFPGGTKIDVGDGNTYVKDKDGGYWKCSSPCDEADDPTADGTRRDDDSECDDGEIVPIKSFREQVEEAVQNEFLQRGDLTAEAMSLQHIEGPHRYANMDPELGPNQVRYQTTFLNEFTGETIYVSVNFDPTTGQFGTIKPALEG